MHAKNVIARKIEKARIKQIKEMTKNRLFIFVELLQLIHNLEIKWKTINEIWLVKQEKKDKKKKSRLEKSVDDEEDDLEFIINKFNDENDFIAFENENDEIENVSHAKYSKHENLHTNHSIDDEFLSRDFLMRWTMNELFKHYIASHFNQINDDFQWW
jgi:cell division protein FtsB